LRCGLEGVITDLRGEISLAGDLARQLDYSLVDFGHAAGCSP
jgi:hypothetical protein